MAKADPTKLHTTVPDLGTDIWTPVIYSIACHYPDQGSELTSVAFHTLTVRS